MTKQQIDCDQALRQIFEFLDHELGEEQRDAMQHHLHTCKSCFSRLEFERLLKGKVRELRDDKASPQIDARIRGLLKRF